MRYRPTALAALTLTLLVSIHTQALSAETASKDYVTEVVEPETYLEQASFKLVRGITNMASSPGEIPKQVVITTKDRGALGTVLGLFKGIGMTTLRAAFGAWETATFLFPNSLDGDFDPILKPEFVWNHSEPTRR